MAEILIMIMPQGKTVNGFRKIKPVIYTKTLSGKNGKVI